jgi:hypothetical protein
LFGGDVIGKNCSPSVEASSTEDQVRITATIPIRNFDSENSSRDEDVFEMLRGDKQKDLQVRTRPLGKAAFQAMINRGTGVLPADVIIGGDSFPIEIPITVGKIESDIFISGTIKTRFELFKIDPPAIVLGLLANVADELELHYQFQTSRIGHWSEVAPGEEVQK